MEGNENRPQFIRGRHGSLYDRGSADSYYRRGRNPHWYPNGTYKEPRIGRDSLTTEEIAEYLQGYRDNEESDCHKEWY